MLEHYKKYLVKDEREIRMKVTMIHQPELIETEIDVRYPKWSARVKHIEKMLLSVEITIGGKCDNVTYRLTPGDIYYIESVDKRTYLYGEQMVYEATERLYQLEEMLKNIGFVRVSKKCLINQIYLQSIKMLPNSHVEAQLRNGEKVIVTRKYITNIREALERTL